jgi:hypothetical protein
MKSKQHLFMPAVISSKWLRVLGAFASMILLLLALLQSRSSSVPAQAQNIPAKANKVIASDSFNRTIKSGWGNANKGGWWTIVGSPWSWSISKGAGSVTVGANSEERAYLSSISTQDVNIKEKIVLPRCTGSGTNCDAYVIGRYTPAYIPTYYRVGPVQGFGRADIFIRAAQ